MTEGEAPQEILLNIGQMSKLAGVPYTALMYLCEQNLIPRERLSAPDSNRKNYRVAMGDAEVVKGAYALYRAGESERRSASAKNRKKSAAVIGLEDRVTRLEGIIERIERELGVSFEDVPV